MPSQCSLVSGSVTTCPVTKRRVQGNRTTRLHRCESYVQAEQLCLALGSLASCVCVCVMEQSRDGQRPASVVKPVGSLYLALDHHRSWVNSFNPTPCSLRLVLILSSLYICVFPVDLRSYSPTKILSVFSFLSQNMCLLMSVQRPALHFLPPGPIRKGRSALVISWKVSDALLLN